MKERRPSGEPVLAEVGPPVILSLGIAGYFSVMRPWAAQQCHGAATERSSVSPWTRAALLATLCLSVACASVPSPEVRVPAEFLRNPEQNSPAAESEGERYTRSFLAYWWNCIGAKAGQLEARCPFVCSGTPGAARGCLDGSAQAEQFVADVIHREGPQRARQRLASWASSSECRNRTIPYFPDGPIAEAASESR
jgi:hypothetical protein